jgi:hypothetical protein
MLQYALVLLQQALWHVFGLLLAPLLLPLLVQQ